MRRESSSSASLIPLFRCAGRQCVAHGQHVAWLRRWALFLGLVVACASPDEPAGCVVDAECKGDRICQRGECTDAPGGPMMRGGPDTTSASGGNESGDAMNGLDSAPAGTAGPNELDCDKPGKECAPGLECRTVVLSNDAVVHACHTDDLASRESCETMGGEWLATNACNLKCEEFSNSDCPGRAICDPRWEFCRADDGCLSDSDCAITGDGMRCISAETGSWCAFACSSDADCPAAQACLLTDEFGIYRTTRFCDFPSSD